MKTKFCHACQTEKPVSDFTRSNIHKDGCQTQCKVCMRNRYREWIARHPEKRAEYWKRSNERMKNKYATDPKHRRERIRAAAAWRKKVGPEVVSRLNRRVRIAREYGLTIEQVDQMLVACGNLCEICKNPKKVKLGIDHCHATGKTRGILCRRCNVAIAALGDNVAGLMRAVEYLRRFENGTEN